MKLIERPIILFNSTNQFVPKHFEKIYSFFDLFKQAEISSTFKERKYDFYFVLFLNIFNSYNYIKICQYLKPRNKKPFKSNDMIGMNQSKYQK